VPEAIRKEGYSPMTIIKLGMPTVLMTYPPRRILPGALFAMALLFAPRPVRAEQSGEQTFVESFEYRTNEGGWTFGTGNEFLAADVGDPGVCVFDASLISYAPRASTSFGVSSVFTGDWAARGVVRIGIDLATAWAEYIRYLDTRSPSTIRASPFAPDSL
jgi:hypothetical protein